MDDAYTLTRRRLIQIGGGAVAAVYLGGLTGTAAAAGVPGALKRSSYASLIGTPFTATAVTGAAATLTLTEVADLARARSEPVLAGRDDAFALSFSGPTAAVLDGGIHELAHPTLGRFSVFIAPVDRAESSQSYEVVVDRTVSLGAAEQQAPAPLAHSNSSAGGAAVPVTAAGAPAKASASKPKPKPAAKPRPLQSATVARRGGVLTADVRVAAGEGIVSVRASLLRDGLECARAGRLLHKRLAVRLNLRELTPVTPGAYELQVTTHDHTGRRVTGRRPVIIR
jgi:hypothetical protein